MTFTEYDPDAPRQFAASAARHIAVAKRTFGIGFGYDMASVKKLDDFIDALGPPIDLEGLVVVIGSYLGEVFRRIHNGQWVWTPGLSEWAVVFPNGVGIFPFSRVAKRLTEGRLESVSYFADFFSREIRSEKPR